MMALFSILGLGFLLGLGHATDPDHVIAVSTIVSREKKWSSAARIGLAWGLGHALMVILVGGAIVTLGWLIPKKLGLGLEFSVALMLILLGLWNLRGLIRWGKHLFSRHPYHSHSHRHGDYIHSHPHGHSPETHGHAETDVPTARLDRRLGRYRSYQTLRPMIVGLVHGLAGSAAVALLVLPLIQNRLWGVAYLMVFGAGTIVGMILITLAMALPFRWQKVRDIFQHRLTYLTGFLSLGFGLFLVYQIGFVEGLFF